MTDTDGKYFILRFCQSETKWTIFELESELIRGFWVNEAKSILYLANYSTERSSIQLDISSLRNITNQSCNPPVGYPSFVTTILHSYSENH